MAEFDPVAAGGIPYNPSAPGGAPAASSVDQIAQPALPGGGAIPAGNPPGFEDTTKAAAAQQVAMTARAQGFANDMFPLLKANEQLKLAPTGPGTEAGYEMSGLLQSRTPEWFQRAAAYASHLIPGVPNLMTPEETTAYSEANKYLTAAQLAVPGATRSNEGGATASAASPSVHIPKPAAQAVLQSMIGLRRMEQDQVMQWQQSGLPVQALPGFVSKFQTTADPRVYVWDQLSKQQQSKTLESMSPAQRKTFMDQITRADNHGIYNNFGTGQP
jgi:hypothetical protein